MAEGLVAAGTVAIDGTKIEANGPAWSNRTRRQIADEILAEADRVDAEEDAKFGERRGDELPESWVASGDRRSRLREALRQVDERCALDWESYQAERTAKEAALGRKLPGRKPGPRSAKGKDRQANTTDPDSRMLRARGTGSCRATTVRSRCPRTRSSSLQSSTGGDAELRWSQVGHKLGDTGRHEPS